MSFSTRYETRTRLVDQHGREVYNELVEPPQGERDEGVAGTLADGVDPGTENAEGQDDANTMPPNVGAKEDVRKEKERVEHVTLTAEPESEVGKETGKDEL